MPETQKTFGHCLVISCFVLLLISVAPCKSQTEHEMETVFTRRVADIIQATYNQELAVRWRDELTVHRNWTDVDYTSGCPARRANWPAQEHFQRIITMASLWSQDQSDLIFYEKISEAMDYWFDDDYLEEDCINAGGQDHLNCPCGTPGFWNTNWYDQMILMPGLIGNACLLMKPYLSATQSSNCTNQLSRAYVRIDGDPNGSMGPMTGANMLDVSSTGVTLALLTSDTATIQSALNRYYNEAQVTEGSADGIKVDGSYMQHSSQLYTGNYGAVFMRALIKIFIQTRETTLSPPDSVQSAFLTLIRGTEWFIYSKDDNLHWQYSVIGRMVSHRYSDWNGIGLNLDELLEGTKSWSSHADFQEIVDRLRNTATKDVNPGPLNGTQFFFTTDYLVHRGTNYIVTLKMFSTRTTNSECNNSQNPYGFHLSDGTIYTYIRGDEYRDVYGAWDWNLIPGTTVDYGASTLACNRVQFKGKESFVGGATLGEAGVAVMKYTNPQTGSLQWSKAYFFFPNTYAVQFVGEINSATNAPVITTLDQRQRAGSVYLDGELVTEDQVTKTAQTLWHDRVGYRLANQAELVVDTRPRQSDWAAIGISQGNETQNLFAAYVSHSTDNMAGFSYFADIDQVEFQANTRSKLSGFTQGSAGLKKDDSREFPSKVAPALVHGAYYGEAGTSSGDRYVALTFWTAGEHETGLEDIARVDTDAPVILLFQRMEGGSGWAIAVSDPSQKLERVNVRLFIGAAEVPLDLDVDLPLGVNAGGAQLIFIN